MSSVEFQTDERIPILCLLDFPLFSLLFSPKSDQKFDTIFEFNDPENPIPDTSFD